MAFDTVIDKTQLETAMTATADAIRGKTGSTADCEWLSDTGFASLIAGIKAGGGSALPPGITAVACGTYTPTADLESDVTVEHGLSVIPNFAIIVIEGAFRTADNYLKKYQMWQTSIKKSYTASYNLGGHTMFVTANLSSSLGMVSIGHGVSNTSFAESTLTLRAREEARLKGGATYRWVTGYLEGLE